VSPLFFDTSVLVAGIVAFEKRPVPAQRVLDAVAGRRILGPLTAWHCCLEFFAVVTRVPVEFRVDPATAVKLVQEEILARFSVLQLPQVELEGLLPAAVGDAVSGARVYDYHLAAIARAAGASAIVTDNPRHFRSFSMGLRVLTSEDLLAELQAPPHPQGEG
jgi:predicted nucleic acid-binding protein